MELVELSVVLCGVANFHPSIVEGASLPEHVKFPIKIKKDTLAISRGLSRTSHLDSLFHLHHELHLFDHFDWVVTTNDNRFDESFVMNCVFAAALISAPLLYLSACPICRPRGPPSSSIISTNAKEEEDGRCACEIGRCH